MYFPNFFASVCANPQRGALVGSGLGVLSTGMLSLLISVATNNPYVLLVMLGGIGIGAGCGYKIGQLQELEAALTIPLVPPHCPTTAVTINADTPTYS